MGEKNNISTQDMVKVLEGMKERVGNLDLTSLQTMQEAGMEGPENGRSA